MQNRSHLCSLSASPRFLPDIPVRIRSPHPSAEALWSTALREGSYLRGISRSIPSSQTFSDTDRSSWIPHPYQMSEHNGPQQGSPASSGFSHGHGTGSDCLYLQTAF